MTSTAKPAIARPQHTMLSKVPEVTVWFWLIKILCTTVGESFADWINVGLGTGARIPFAHNQTQRSLDFSRSNLQRVQCSTGRNGDRGHGAAENDSEDWNDCDAGQRDHARCE